MIKKSLFVVMVLMFNLIIVFAQSGILSGRVTDEDKMSLAGANVFIKELQKGATTNLNGEFKVLNLKEGKYVVTVSYIGYNPVEQEVVIRGRATTQVNIKMLSGVLLGEEILVLGDRLKGQAKALNIQKSNSNISNIVSSDQIGRFPDANVGDALKRVPSLTVNYDQGEARFANIRGTEPRLNSISINGERIPSAEAEIRSVQLDLIPSDVIQTIEVNKALTPDMEADAIGGSVNLVTRQAPYDFRISGTLGSGYNNLSKKPIYTGAIVFSDRIMDNKIGYVISGAYHNHHLASHNSEGVWGKKSDGTIYATEWDIRRYDIKRIRKSISGAVDFKLSDNSTIILSGIYNHRDDLENRFRITYKLKEPDANGLAAGSEIRRQTKGGIDNSDNENRRLEDQRTYNLGLTGNHIAFGNIKLDWGLSYSKASEKRPNERYIGWNAKKINVATNISDTRKPYFEANVPYDKFGVKEITEMFQDCYENDLNGRFNIEIPITIEGDYKNTLKFGGRFKNKEKLRDNRTWLIELTDNGKAYLANFTKAENQDYTLDNFLAGDYKSGLHTTPAFLGKLNFDDSNLFKKTDYLADYKAGNFDAKEKVYAGYAMLNQYIGKNIFVIAGIRLEHTRNDYSGFKYDDGKGTVEKTAGNNNYTNVLPGINIKYMMDENTIFRLAWTNSIARPNYYQLVPYRSISADGSDEEIELGNPELKPTKSMNLDLMFEKYFESVGVVSAGVFYKSINDFIYTHLETDYTEPTTGKLYNKFKQPRNGADAKLFGFEFALQRQFDFLPGIFRNFGIYANYTYTYSEATFPSKWSNIGTDSKLKLPGTAPHTLNLALNYQSSTLNAGLAFNYSSAYLDPDELDFTPGLERYYDKVIYLDFNASYAFTTYFRLFVEANNLLNQPLRYYAGNSDRTYQAEYYDRRYSAGIKFDL